MAVDIDQIRAYTDGGVYVTDYGVTVTAPTDAGSALNAGFKAVGAISEDGVTESSSQDRTDVFIWQGATLVRRIPGQFSKTWTVAVAEVNAVTVSAHFPGSTITQTVEGLSIAEKPPTTDIRQWVIEGLDGVNKERIYIPKGEITERGDVVWSSGEITVREWTLSGYVDEQGVVAYRFIVDDALAL
ncbi:hypothetical protein [Paractinoplanes maris]|uniref:phage tail tube protein n=1 Tax=Paractinoplanes maris TaxID=1734446 RepID=UPI00202280B7|nr:hypothetical protein [Actinoplanes maris]